MTQPAHHALHVVKHPPRRQRGPGDQDHRQAQGTGGIQFRACAAAACVLGDDMADAMTLHQGKIAVQGKRAARDDGLGIGQRQGIRRIDKPQQVMMLRFCGKEAKLLFANGKKDPRGGVGQGDDGGLHIGHLVPVVVRPRDPWRALKARQRQAKGGTGRKGVAAHPGGEGVGCIHDMGDPIVHKIGLQPLDPAKSTNTGRQWLRHRGFGAPGIGKDAVHLGLCEATGKRACLGGAAQKKDAVHG